MGFFTESILAQILVPSFLFLPFLAKIEIFLKSQKCSTCKHKCICSKIDRRKSLMPKSTSGRGRPTKMKMEGSYVLPLGVIHKWRTPKGDENGMIGVILKKWLRWEERKEGKRIGKILGNVIYECPLGRPVTRFSGRRACQWLWSLILQG